MIRFHRRFHPPKVISFDLDDTLYDNVPIIKRTEERTHSLITERVPKTREWDIEHWRQRRLDLMRRDDALADNMTALRRATLLQGFRELEIDDADTVTDEIMDAFLAFRSDFSVSEQVHDLLDQLASRYSLVAVSNGNADVKRVGIGHYFKLALQPTHDFRGKPNTDMFEYVKQAMNCAPEAILHVGDSPQSDVFGAQRAGMQSVWLTSGLGRSHQLRVLPTVTIDDLQELSALLL
ncbi:MAG: putative phosphohydrolase, HAD superfamily protein [Idiomarina sp. T82-3]|uniref:HAD-IA family hydrolase n=1 Tax=Idiomarina TaxID=135575 RepID=UPI0007929913|nr:HAD-IA family hydrolase [Idiomarina sp. T82-3]KXS34317.1 MAG: putative phosphohydrolase, HAD superfamily protein [Idiomarina sp. T82-3]